MQASERSLAVTDKSTDDALTLVSLGIIAFVLAIVTHEGLGHGLATLAVGGKPVMLTTCYFSSSGSLSKWIPAAGGIANVIVGLLSILGLRIMRTANPHIRFFLVLVAAFNLLFAAGYPAYSGIAAFGDWAAVISGLSPAWLWRVLLVAFSVISYYLSLRLLAVDTAAKVPLMAASMSATRWDVACAATKRRPTGSGRPGSSRTGARRGLPTPP